MDCPFCGEEIPDGSETCPACGEDSDESFLQEAFSDLANGNHEAVPVVKPARRPEPAALKPSKRLDWKGILALTAAGAVVGILIVVAILVIPGGTKVALSKPQQAVEAYYEALSRSDLNGILSLMADSVQPTEAEKAELEKAISQNTYKVSDLQVKVVDSDTQASHVSIGNVVVTVKPTNGGASVTHSLVDEILQPAQQSDPAALMLVRLDFYGNTWKISSRPNGGWAPNNVWALGQPGEPMPTP
jgi:zinc-ribbon domain